ncbi:VOC family protein [Streptomyces aidingensis]|uniref:Catechol 2,3-dioxygenase n=1 Tax=Streptomyces aidingensis TaxID=910347 RepID=A0A1I1TEX2_9ACTN|nr:VOC family protein [Streptomyces aidingensis]SFD57124.1 Catechol 2,3-dioxygenase [Streptomyces aidingensis]
MIRNVAIATVWSTDQDRDVKFFTDKLGFEVRTDLEMGSVRWLTVGVPGQADMELTVMPSDGPGLDPESAEMLTTLVSKGVLGAAVLRTDDCHGDYKRFKDAGVEFLQEPMERPYGVEAIFRDPSGNWYSLTEERDSLDTTKPWPGAPEG